MNNVIDEVVSGLSALPGVEVVLKAVTAAGVELQVYGAQTPSAEARRALLQRPGTDWDFDVGPAETRDGGVGAEGNLCHVVYRILEDSTAALGAVVREGRASSGATALWADIAAAELAFDRSGRGAALCRLASTPYHDGLAAAFVTLYRPLLAPGRSSLLGQARAAAERGDVLALADLVTAFVAGAVELVFAVNRRACPGGGRARSLVAALDRSPAGWDAAMAALELAMHHPVRRVPEALESLAAALRAWLPPVAEAPAVRPTGPLVVHTDGGCLGNPGKGAWAYLIDDGSQRLEGTGAERVTTNNRMELQAVIQALATIAERQAWRGRAVRVVTDSQYVRNGITTWIRAWEANGWKTAAKEPVKNQELWKELQGWDRRLNPTWSWVKGHAGDPANERCDALVRQTMDRL